MSHVNAPLLNYKLYSNDIFLKALATKTTNNESKIKYLLKNMNNDSIVSVLAGYENKIELLQKKIEVLEKKFDEFEIVEDED
tara:strand:- start:1108 stop:1353 length:246 start_codon:yes stop_codon:yes gene_type:complete